MIRFLLRRIVTMAVTLLIISALVFFIIKLPPGDFLTNQIAELKAQGEAASAAKAEFLIKQYGLDRPVWEQYLVWIGAMLGPPLLNLLRVRNWPARGLAIGTASHGIGTARALQVNEVAGAFSGLAMGLNALATALLLPLLWRLLF